MADYSKGVIYTIRYKDDASLIYVGSTIQSLSKRWYDHKNRCFNEKSKEYEKKLYQKIRETNDIQNWYIELYERFPCSNKQELNKREGEIIREIGNLNINIAGRTKKEWDNDEEYYKKYYDINKYILNEKNKEYREHNKEKIKEQRKEYRENNKEIIKEKKKDYYEDNKIKIIEKRKEKITCECGSIFRITDKARHFKTKKHAEFLELKNDK